MRLKLGQSKKSYLVIAAAVVIVGVGGVVTKALFLGGSGTPLSSSDIDLQRGLVGWWKLDGNGKDSTPYSANGTSTGSPAATTDREGSGNAATSFDGSSYYTLGNPSQLQITGSQTISMWLKPASFSSRQNPFCKAYGGEGCITQETGGALTYYYGTAGANASPYQQIGTGNVLAVGSWTHVVIVRDLNAMKLTWFVNGSLKASATASYSAAVASTNSVLIGAGYAGKYNGSIDDVRVYNRALSANEVSALYSEYNPGLNLDSGQAGLVGWWKLDGNAKDSTPYGNDGTVTGATPTADREGRSNGAYSFNGTSDYIQVPDINLSANSFSATAWFKPNAAGDEKIIGTYNGSSGTSLLQIFTGGQLRVCITFCAVATDNLVDGSWHFAVVVGDGSSIRAYVDGNPTPVITHAAISYNINGTTYIGRDPQTGGYRFNGSIDDVRLYKRALTVSEIANLYDSYDSNVSLYSSAGSGGQSVNLSQGLVGQWDFSGNARDATPYADNGTVNGASLTNDRSGRPNSAYQLGDSGAWINVGSPAILNGANGFTYNIWLMRTGGSVYHWPEIMGSSNTHVYYGIRSGNYGDSIYFEYGKSPYDGSAFTGTSGQSLPINQWHMCTVSYDGSNLKIYWDSALKQTITSVVLDPSFGGMSFTTSSNGWNGTIDDARAYNRALNASEVAALYNLTD